MNTANRARIARRRAQRLGLRLSQSGNVFRVCDTNNVTLALGPLGVVDAYLIERLKPTPPGPPRRTYAPPAWAPMVDEYLLTLAAAGQRPETMRLRYFQLCQVARGLRCRPESVTGAMLLDWFGRQQHWTPEGRKSYRAGVRGFFGWAQRFARLPTNPADALPTVRVPKAPPRPASDQAWDAALAHADARMRLMLRLAAEAGLRRAEVAVVHTNDLVEINGLAQLVVKGKGGKPRVVPVSR